MSGPLRIAMWSGPRNISTAMMRSFENRADTVVWDEPLYACYLKATGIEHPLGEEIIATYETDWRKVVARCTGPVPEGASVFYQKHMTHHLLPEIGLDWLREVSNCFLIREPARVVASYAARRARPTLEDLGFPQQLRLFEAVCEQTGRIPPVLDADDVLADPRRMLGLLCQAVGLEFDTAMLSWPAGRRDSDGLWAAHWYAAVEASTGFAAPSPAKPLDEELRPLAEAAAEGYARLRRYRLGA